jgi:release factor glutamine methyltransferase
MGLRFDCTPDVLIPRRETELLAGVALDLIRDRPGLIVDVGTGCGNLAVVVALHAPDTRVLALDISRAALDVARRNVARYGLEMRIELICGDLFSPLLDRGLEGQVDLIVCNPPYIPTGSLEKMDPVIRIHEPRVALDAGPYGLDIFRRLISDAPRWLRSGGRLAFEIGAGQDRMVKRLFRGHPQFAHVDTHSDGDVVRVFSAEKA